MAAMGITSRSGNYRKSFQTQQPYYLTAKPHHNSFRWAANSLSANPNSVRFIQPFYLSAKPPNKSFRLAANSFSANPDSARFIQRISAVNSSDPTPRKNNDNNPIVSSYSDYDDQNQPPPPMKKPTLSSVFSTSSTRRRDEWAVDSWKTKKARDELTDYPDMIDLESVLETLGAFPPLVSAGEARDLQELLGEAAMGNAFLLQGGDCAETFNEFNPHNIRDTICLLIEMGYSIAFGGPMPVIKVVGRMAGQFVNHNLTDAFEKRDGVELPSYRGDMVNGDAFDMMARTPDPERLIRAYFQSAATLYQLNSDSIDLILKQHLGLRIYEIADATDEAYAASVKMDYRPIMSATDFWTSHECLHLPYEQSLTRMDSTSGLYYDCSGHMLWVGDRTCQLDGAHVEFLRGVANPLGIKVSDKMDPIELVKLIEILNPQNKAGRITIITRMGTQRLRSKLPHLIRAVRGSGQIVTWVTDPMRGKTHGFNAICEEVRAFFDVHEQEGSHPGGVHLEMAGQNTSEYIPDMGPSELLSCDPRLNTVQSLDLAHLIGYLFRKRKMSLVE